MEHIGTVIKKNRLIKNLNQNDLAKIVGVSRQSIVKYENNQRTPPIDVAGRIASALNISVHDLLVPSNDSMANEHISPQKKAHDISEYVQNNPTFDRNGVVGHFINSIDFQIFITGLLSYLLNEKMTERKMMTFKEIVKYLIDKDFSNDVLNMIDLMLWDLSGLNMDGLHKVYEYLKDMREMPKYRKKANELIQEEIMPTPEPNPPAGSPTEKPSIY